MGFCLFSKPSILLPFCSTYRPKTAFPLKLVGAVTLMHRNHVVERRISGSQYSKVGQVDLVK